MAVRVQMEQVKLEGFSLKGMKSTEDQSPTYILNDCINKAAYSSCKT